MEWWGVNWADPDGKGGCVLRIVSENVLMAFCATTFKVDRSCRWVSLIELVEAR